MKASIITLSRQFCTGGSQIAQRVAEQLGVPFYDKQIITLAAQESGLSEEAIRASEQSHAGSLLYGLYTMGAELPLGDQVYIVQSRVLQRLAEEGPCVIVGRCGDYVLRKEPELLRVFVHADLDFRRRWGQANGLLPADAADRMLDNQIAREDKRRASYYNYYTEYRWGAVEHHDLCLNAALGEDTCVDLILKAARG